MVANPTPREKLIDSTHGRSLPIAREWELVKRTVGGLTHEVNNQLAPILLQLRVLRPKLGDEDLQILDQLHSGVKRSSRLIRQLEWVLERRPEASVACDLRQILRALERSMSETCRSLRITLILPEDEVPVLGDPVTLLHAFESLGQFCSSTRSEGDGWLRVEVELVQIGDESQPGERSWTLVKVTSPGESDALEAFESLSQPLESGRGSSLRLGVDLVALDTGIRENGGRIEIENHQAPENDQGPLTCYRIYLPSALPQTPTPHEASTAKAFLDSNEIVLVAEDEPIVGRVIQTLLASRGISSVVCKDGREALSTFLEHEKEVAVVLTDISMPVMGGVELGQRIREIAQEVPMVFMTGASDDKARAKGVSVSQDLVLSKPFGGDELLAVLESAMASRR